MITKGTEDYKRAQEIANDITRTVMTTRNFRQGYIDSVDGLACFCDMIAELGGFAASVAASVEKTLGKYFQVGYCSNKQAWILATAAVENNVTYHSSWSEYQQDRRNENNN